jgi:hypothetical protein
MRDRFRGGARSPLLAITRLDFGVISNSSIAFLIAGAALGASTLPIGVADVAPRRKNVLVAFVLGHTIASCPAWADH